jgi:hypothetical protein
MTTIPNKSNRYSWITWNFSGSTTINNAAGITATAFPIPPKSTMDTRSKESAKLKLAGAIKPDIAAYIAPAKPARKFPTIKAVIFQRGALMPNEADATSSKRIHV